MPKRTTLVWWIGKCGHEWDAPLSGRLAGEGCPYCAGKRVAPEMSLAALHPDLAAEWHQTKNSKGPDQYLPGSNVKVWWLGKCGHEWDAIIANRAKRGRGCRYCAGQAVDPARSLAAKFPEIAAEWHPTKNGDLGPDQVMPSSHSEKRWWLCAAGHEWDDYVSQRTRRNSPCPYCAKSRVSAEHNLAVLFPELAAEWHPTKNDDVRPEDLMPGSEYKAHWICARGHEWTTMVYNRTNESNRTGCPKCGNQSSLLEIRVYCELGALFPDVRWKEKIAGLECDVLIPSAGIAVEVDGSYWHTGKEDLDHRKNAALAAAGVTLIRLRESPLEPMSEDDIVVEKREPQRAVLSRLAAALARRADLLDGHEVRRLLAYAEADTWLADERYREVASCLPGPPPEKSVEALRPDLAAQWNHQRNAPLLPRMFSPGSEQEVWWVCERGHEWESMILNRNAGNGCPGCSGRQATPERNLAVLHPDIAAEWHPVENGDLRPDKVTPASNTKVWWRCAEGHDWEASPAQRTTMNNRCNICHPRRRGGPRKPGGGGGTTKDERQGALPF